MRSCVSHIVVEDSKYLKLLMWVVFTSSIRHRNLYKVTLWEMILKSPEPLNKIHRYPGGVAWRPDNRSSLLEIMMTDRNIKFCLKERTKHKFRQILKFFIMDKVQTILSDTTVWTNITVIHCKNLKICLIVIFQNGIEMVSRLLSSSSRKILLQFEVPCKNRKQCCLFSYSIVFWYIWDSREHKRKRETAHNSGHYHAYAAKHLSGLFFISLFPGQNADHAAFQIQQ